MPPLRAGVKPKNSVLVSIIIPAISQYYHTLWTSDRDKEDKVVLLSPHAVGCIWIIFVPNSIWMTIRSALGDILWPVIDRKSTLTTMSLAISSGWGKFKAVNALNMPMYTYLLLLLLGVFFVFF